jgi:hypothetical protein
LYGVNPKYRIHHVAVQHDFHHLPMYLVIIGWIYVVLMMAVAEATSSTGTGVGAVFTFVLYGAAPVSLVVYLLGRRGGRREQDGSAQPDGSSEAPADAVAPVRKEP